MAMTENAPCTHEGTEIKYYYRAEAGRFISYSKCMSCQEEFGSFMGIGIGYVPDPDQENVD